MHILVLVRYSSHSTTRFLVSKGSEKEVETRSEVRSPAQKRARSMQSVRRGQIVICFGTKGLANTVCMESEKEFSRYTYVSLPDLSSSFCFGSKMLLYRDNAFSSTMRNVEWEDKLDFCSESYLEIRQANQ